MNFFNEWNIDYLKPEIIQTIIAIALLYLVRIVFGRIVKKRILNTEFSTARKTVVIKIVNLILVILLIAALYGVWGVESENLLLILSSVVTILGVAFFAQWSLLANITSGLILFFQHPLRIGSNIKILDKDYPIEGTIIDITAFFVTVKRLDSEKVMIPNSVVLQKPIIVLGEIKKN
ncbi:MAG: small-conductance mechanosensitive channel [Parvicellaceae bacterium]|jgi:small-conductance mechanosensitive channel